MANKKIKKNLPLLIDNTIIDDLSDYELISTLGAGSFGKVLLAFHKEKGYECAIKIIEKNSVKNHDLKRLLSEATILSALDHKNIVKFYSAREKKDYLFLFTERVKYGSLSDLMKEKLEKNDELTDEQSSLIMKNILKALNYIHSRDIVHRDLKPANILLENPNDFTSVKITDFGLSAMVSDYSSRFFTEQCGTPLYMAPELIENKIYSKPVDIWSCGIIMFWLCNKGNHPFNYSSREELSINIVKGNWKFPEKFSKLAIDFILKLCCKEPVSRYTANQALNHPWITRNENSIPLTFEEQHHLFLKQLELTNLFKIVFFLRFIIKKQIIIQKTKTSNNILQLPNSKDRRPKSVSDIYREKFKDQLLNLQINKDNTIKTEQEKKILPISANLNQNRPKQSVDLPLSPEKNIRIRSITNSMYKSFVENEEKKEFNSPKTKKPINLQIFSTPRAHESLNLRKTYSPSIKTLENKGKFLEKQYFESPIEKQGKILEKPPLFDVQDHRKTISNHSFNKKDIYQIQKNIRLVQEKNDFTRESVSYSPVKKKSNFKFFKDKKHINDIDLDKESLFQLNRATNQFFAQKLKDTLQESNKNHEISYISGRNNDFLLSNSNRNIRNFKIQLKKKDETEKSEK